MPRRATGGFRDAHVQESHARAAFCLLVLLTLGGAVGAVAQEPQIAAGGRQKSVRIVRAAAPPDIDGILGEAEWAGAATVDDFHQIQPTEYAAPSEPTIVYLMYDEDALYVGARLYDREPDQITARILRQGSEVFGDDWFSLIIDPFYDRRSGYRFQTNPNGLRHEALFQNVSDEQWDWNGIWYAAAAIDAEGWTAEMAIPYKTLSFDPLNDTWGINFRRAIARRDERMGWVSRNRATDPSTSGIAVGFEGLEQGIGLDVIPSVAAGRRRDLLFGTADSSTEPSLDLFYKITPSLTGSVTINTDFSATEVDDRQVNLSRFALFYPEKRSFFLQDADIFEFGRIDQNGRPFFSRRIGLGALGDLVDIAGGSKISGRIGRWNLGLLSIRQDESLLAEADNATVARVSANVLGESSVGIIATEGSPQSTLNNSVFGADFLYRNTRLPGGRLLEAEAWAQRSDTEGVEGDDRAYGFGLRSPNNTGLRGGMRYSVFEQNFQPELGFVNRVGIRQLNAGTQFTHRPRTGYLRSILGGVNMQRVEYLDDGSLQQQRVRYRVLELESREGDELAVEHATNEEVLRAPFELFPGLFIADGRYRFGETRVSFASADQRRVFGGLAWQTGGFFGGDRDEISGNVSWRPSGHFSGRLSYTVNEIDLPDGAFTSRLLSMRADIAFSSRLSWVNLIQYDNVSEILGVNSRLHWIPEAGREVFLVLNHNLEDKDEDNRFHSAYAEAAVKLSYTFRF
ncbi:MAG: carbohydrate binding family 9 domain-containing protein [Gammaproteobacteria bacterium]|nr:carbohydrate binding family 9 domain-containing protein [Gammaproteobacteria bacterium]